MIGYHDTTVTPANKYDYPWTYSTTDPRGLQKVNASDRIGACWYNSGTWTMAVTLPTDKYRRIALYCVDWDTTQRSQIIEVRDTASNALLDTRTVSGFNPGQYLVWDVRGNITFKFTQSGVYNAVLSGIFFSTPHPYLQDADSDGLADYIEDANGDGLYGTGDLANWGSNDTDGDGIIDGTEFLQGRNPRVYGTSPDTYGTYIQLKVF